jgi:GAF domain-containing protein
VSPAPDDFARRYAAALDAATGEGDEAALHAAYELGRGAVNQELSVLDLAAVHHDALLARLRTAAEPDELERMVRAAGDFFLESLSAYEMLQRVLRESRAEARAEQRQTALLRRLSGFLADASIALDADASLEEILQLVAEHALEVVDAAACTVRLAPAPDRPAAVAAVAEADADGAATDRSNAPRLSAPLTALDGREVGGLELTGRGDRAFSALDEAALVQLAQMASAAVERAELYRRHA